MANPLKYCPILNKCTKYFKELELPHWPREVPECTFNEKSRIVNLNQGRPSQNAQVWASNESNVCVSKGTPWKHEARRHFHRLMTFCFLWPRHLHTGGHWLAFAIAATWLRSTKDCQIAIGQLSKIKMTSSKSLNTERQWAIPEKNLPPPLIEKVGFPDVSWWNIVQDFQGFLTKIHIFTQISRNDLHMCPKSRLCFLTLSGKNL